MKSPGSAHKLLLHHHHHFHCLGTACMQPPAHDQLYRHNHHHCSIRQCTPNTIPITTFRHHCLGLKPKPQPLKVLHAGTRQRAQAALLAAQGGEGGRRPGPHCRSAEQQQGEWHHWRHGRLLQHTSLHEDGQQDHECQDEHHIHDEPHCPLQV